MIATQLAAGQLIRVRQSVFLGAEHWPTDAAGQHLVRARAETLVVLDAAARLLCASYVTKPRRADYSNARHRSRAIEELEEVARTCGVGGLAEALELVEPARESPAESLTAGHIHLTGIPQPLYQAAVRTPAGTLYPDCLWAEEHLVGECDGAGKYTDEASIVHEKERELTLLDLGSAWCAGSRRRS